MSDPRVFQKTVMLKPKQVNRRWLLVDATGKTLGRLASEIAKVLRGKHRASYTPHVDCGDGVIVINAGKIHVTGNKEAQKTFDHYTGYIHGRRMIPYRTMLARKPEAIITRTVKGMVPRTSQGRAQMKRLRVFAGSEHELDAQQPIQVSLT